MINPEAHALTGTVEIRIDMTLHPGQQEPVDPAERIAWAYMDTAYSLIRVGAVRAALEGLRDKGDELPSDELLFSEPDGPKTYLDLAPADDLAAYGLAQAYTRLENLALTLFDRALRDAADIESL